MDFSMKTRTPFKISISFVLVSLLTLLLMHYNTFLINVDKTIAYLESFHPYLWEIRKKLTLEQRIMLRPYWTVWDSHLIGRIELKICSVS